MFLNALMVKVIHNNKKSARLKALFMYYNKAVQLLFG
jgi:hypothetical protein